MEQLTLDFRANDNPNQESSNAQAAMILRALKRGEKLTPLDMLDRFGVLRASGRIYDLKEAGYNIEKEMIKTPSGKRVAQYFLVQCLALLLMIATACEKEPVAPDQPEQFRPIATAGHRDTLEPIAGRYKGTMYYCVPGLVEQTINTTREIRHLSDSTFDCRWWSWPDTSVIVHRGDTLHYTMTSDVTNTNCGHQRVIWDYSSTATFENNTITEYGTVRYRLYYYGELVKELHGTWHSSAAWHSKLYN